MHRGTFKIKYFVLSNVRIFTRTKANSSKNDGFPALK